MKFSHILLPAAAVLLAPFFAVAQEVGEGAKPAKAATTPADETADAAIQKFSVAPGLQVDVWASEPLLQNPVAF